MKHLTTGLLMLATAVLLVSCQKNMIRGNGPQGSRFLTLPAFSQIELHYDIKANISYGTSQSVKVSGYENLLDILDLSVQGEVLKIKFSDQFYNIRNNNVVADITLPMLSKAVINGSGNMLVSGFRQGAQMEAYINGSGNIDLSNCEYEKAFLTINGSGDINAKGLLAREATASVYGSGHTSISVADKLVARIFGSGNIYYWGSPSVEVSINGSGRVIKK
jgi:hypothetical protein